ncbi:hypothetical protein K2X33_14125 [bacterium]|nr:hypothetical protein [bacterium]
MFKRTFWMALVALVLTACGENNPWASYTYSNDDDKRTRLATDASFVQAKDGTLYSISCLKAQGAQIASGVASAGRNCSTDNLSEEQVRGIYAWDPTTGSTFRFVNPMNYFGGTTQQMSNFCSSNFGYAWTGCFAWLGYSNYYYGNQQYQPSCSSCTSGVQTMIYPPQNSCPSYCQTTSNYNNYSWYNNWNQNGWTYSYY